MSDHIDGTASDTGDNPVPAGNIDSTTGFVIIDPGSRSGRGRSGDSDGDGTDSGQRRRGRPRSTSSGSTSQKDTSTLAGVDFKDILLSIHLMLAAFLKTPELALDPEEAVKLERSIKRVSKHYPLAVSQKHLDMTMLLATVAEIYGTRAVAIYSNRNSDRDQSRGTGPTGVVAGGDNVTLFTAPVGGTPFAG